MPDPAVKIRRATPRDAAAMARVHVASWRTAYAGIIPADYLAGLTEAPRVRLWRHATSDPEQVVYVAETAAGAVVGFASGGRQHNPEIDVDADLYAIYLLDAFQGLGIGRRLTTAVARWLHQHGHKSLLIWVLADNPSRGFYQALGGTELQRTSVEIGGANLELIGYHWPDISKVASRSD